MRIKPIYGKVLLAATLRCDTGLHIGASKELLDIGGIDSPVVRDPVTHRPYLPGSSMKGKLRSLMERAENKEFNRRGSPDTFRHECTDPDCAVCRLFGAAGGRDGENLPSRLLVRDLSLTEESLADLEQIDTGLLYTEWKFENGLDRVTSAANPRQIERVPAGAEFHFSLVYTIESPQAEAQADLNHVLMYMEMLEDDALGGHGSRGYGRVTFSHPQARSRTVAHYRDHGRGEAPLVEAGSLSELRGRLAEIVQPFFVSSGE